jgi:16S rRNA (adenine1518-N6/adenine1519-N6)-dimethyltransferase
MNILPGPIANTANLSVITDSSTIVVPDYSVYGNIPYYITSPILHHFLYDVDHTPQEVIFTMQKEVADRILARDGKHSVLSLSCHLVANIDKICDINPSHFIPVPKVWSTCLKFTLREHDKIVTKKILFLIRK